MESLVQIESEEFNPESSNGCYESSDSQLCDSLLSGFEEFKESEGDISNAKNNLKKKTKLQKTKSSVNKSQIELPKMVKQKSALDKQGIEALDLKIQKKKSNKEAISK